MLWFLVDKNSLTRVERDSWYIVKNNEDQWGEKPWQVIRGWTLIQQLRWSERKYRGEIQAFAKLELPLSISTILSAMHSGAMSSSSRTATTCRKKTGRPTTKKVTLTPHSGM